MKGRIFLFLLVGFFSIASAQAPVRKFSQVINRPSVNVSAPFISLDGNTLLYISDYSEDRVPTLYLTLRQGADWMEPKPLPKHINTRMNYVRGTTLSADGKTIYLSTIRSGGVGGYDIWAGSIAGTSWGDLQNLGAPVNSKLHEAAPTFTPDGATMYFMRCEKMTDQRAEGCKIMVTNKAPNGRWEEPTELPAPVNQGNSQTPRISADGQILIFSSDAMPGKGGMDLFASRLTDGGWTNPFPLGFVNTERDDQFVSLIANGRYLLKEAPGKSTTEILEFLMPADWQPKAVMRVEGNVTAPEGIPTPAYISVTDVQTHKRVYSGRPDSKGYYFFYLVQGSTYELSIDPEEGSYTYFSKMFDLTPAVNPLAQRADAVLKPIAHGDEIDLEGVRFKPYSSELVDDAAFELRRLSRLIRSAPQLSFELQVMLHGLEQDTVPSSPDLTETRMDSVIVYRDGIDSLGNSYSYDSMIVKTTYHNDRTEDQALTIINQLLAMGIDSNTVSYTTQAKIEPLPENKKTIVRLVARRREQN